MIRAELQQSYFDEQHDDFAWRTVASITVEDDGTHHGECPERFGLRKVVLDPERHERVRFDDDPARWLRGCPIPIAPATWPCTSSTTTIRQPRLSPAAG